MTRVRWRQVALGAILCVAVLTRFIGIAHQNTTDENKLVSPAAALRIRHVDRPLFPSGARYPHASVFWFADHVPGVDASNRTVVARITTAVVGVLTVLLTVWIGRRLGGWPLGLLGGVFLAVSPLAAKYAHYAHVDTLAALPMLAAVAAALLLWERGTPRWYLATGFFVGLAAAMQYYGIAIGAVLVLAHLGWVFQKRPVPWRALIRPAFIGGLLMIPLTFALTNPWKLIARQEALEIYRGLALRAQGGDLGYTSPHIFWPLTTQSPDWGLPFTVSGLIWETSPPIFLLALVGVCIAIRRRDARMIVLIGVLVFVLYLAMAGYVRMNAVKRFLPLSPLLALAAAYGVVYASALLPRVKHIPRIAAYALAIVGVTGALWNIGAFDFAYAGKATLPTAVIWAEEHLPAGSTVLQHGPLLFLSPSSTRHKVLALREDYANFGREDRRVANHRARPLTEWLQEGAEYVVIDSRLADRYYEPTSIQLYPDMTASYRSFYDEIRSRGTRVFFIEPEPWQSAGPRIEIYDVRALR